MGCNVSHNTAAHQQHQQHHQKQQSNAAAVTPAKTPVRDKSFVHVGSTASAAMPSMIWDLGRPLIPEQESDVKGRITVVLDLDETLIRAHQQPTGPPIVTPRPHLSKFLDDLKDTVETIVWTSSSRLQAQYVIRTIDPGRVIRHCVYRHGKWMSRAADGSYTKDLRLVGRDMDRTLIIENTPDCISMNTENAILVEDFLADNDNDNTLWVLSHLITELAESKLSVPDFLATCELVTRFPTPLRANPNVTIPAYNTDSAKALENWSPESMQKSQQASADAFRMINDRTQSTERWRCVSKELQDLGLTLAEQNQVK